MKKLLLIVFLIFFSWGFGQNLSLSELISLRSVGLETVEIYLTKKGWDFTYAEEEKGEELASINFVYGSQGNFEHGESFIHRLYSSNGKNRLAIVLGKKTKYLEYLNAVRNFSPNTLFSGQDKGDFMKIYQGANNTFIFRTTTVKNPDGNSSSNWVITIMTNEDFEEESYKVSLNKK